MDGDCCYVENNKRSKLRLSGATEGYSRRYRTISLGGRYCQAADEIRDHLILVREEDHNYQKTVDDPTHSKEILSKPQPKLVIFKLSLTRGATF